MTITGRSKVLGIIGWPVDHSLSPLMQNAALQAAGLDAVYVPFPVEPAALPTAVQGLRALGVTGCNVTVPHKKAIIPHLDRIDPLAAAIGAVNTVVNEGGCLVGYNTDAPGFLQAVTRELAFVPQGGRVVLLGSGGAARGAAFALADAGVARLVIANRTLATATELVDELTRRFPAVECLACPLEGEALRGSLGGCTLLVNTTTVGMGGTAFPDLDLACLPKDALVYDMVYAPAVTPLLEAARRCQLSAANGISMLVGQGELAFQRWFGQAPSPGIMQESLLTALGGRSSA